MSISTVVKPYLKKVAVIKLWYNKKRLEKTVELPKEKAASIAYKEA
jgi:hypothetical protein